VLTNARTLAAKLAAVEGLELLSDGSLFPIVAMRASDPETLDVKQLSRHLRERGWIVPAYTLPANAQHIEVLRIVVKENLSRDMVDILAEDVRNAVHAILSGQDQRPARQRRRPHC
jgi:glutamate decarboxylase